MSDRAFLTPLFGISLDPAVQDIPVTFSLTKLADTAGLDFVSIQDHPYNATFLDTWTLLSVLGGLTQHVRLFPNVANLPLRHPAMLAKAAATLDILTNGRVELGLGAGGFWEAIVTYGGPNRTAGEAVEALEEGIQVIRTLWQPLPSKQTVSFSGKYYQLQDAHPGPAPHHPIGIWLGALRPRMLRLIGRVADGWIVTASYVPPENISAAQSIIDEAAVIAGRDPTTIRRVYNLAGSILRPDSSAIVAHRKGLLAGPVSRWIEEITRYYLDLRMDTFIFWPLSVEEEQIRLFAEDVVPGVRAAASKRKGE
jgi:alkanesulfonate monooxygenase SsuD/methylene tetrahydromethanopterin reductase-like flavin-dependent oxidoreductase (luciferase family)